MSQRSHPSRRDLLKTAGAAAAAAAIPSALRAEPAPAARRQSANDKVVLGLIGCGGMGAANMRNLMNHPDVDVAALCDVDAARVPGDFNDVKKKYGKDPAVYKDYRNLLDRKDIDAVIIGTPDHWHALNFIHAVQAGKDVYMEKPLSHNLVETIAMAGAHKRYGRVVQVGTWQRSTKVFTDALDYVRSGKLGKVVLCRAWITDTFRAGRVKPSDPPSSLDYDLWIGPAAKVPYQSNRVHWNWRWFMNTGGGMTTDWGVHMMDIALLGMSKDQDLPMPRSVSAYGGRYAILDDDRDAPDLTEAIYRFENPDFTMHWAIRRDFPGLPGHCTEFVGADGRVVRVWRDGWRVLAPDGKDLEKPEAAPPPDHWRNWLDCIKTREKPRADLRSVAQTTAVCHLANIAMMSGETVRWDDSKWDLAGNTGKRTPSYRRSYRRGYSLPMFRP